MNTIIINLLVFGTLFSSVLAITSKNPVVSVIFVISTFVNAAGYLILMGISFVGISYIIIYVGAIAVLFLFVIMMINIKLTDILETGNQYTKNLPLALSIGFLFIYLIFTIIPFNIDNGSSLDFLLDFNNKINSLLLNSDLLDIKYNMLTNSSTSDTLISDFVQISSIGYALYVLEPVFLILSGSVFLLAMLGVIITSTSKKTGTELNTINLNTQPVKLITKTSTNAMPYGEQAL